MKTVIDGIRLEKIKQVGMEWSNGHRDSWISCTVNDVRIERELESVANEAPTPNDFALMQSHARTKFKKYGQYLLPNMTDEFINKACEWFAKAKAD